MLNNGVIAGKTVVKVSEDTNGYTYYLYKPSNQPYSSIREMDETKGNLVIMKYGVEVDYSESFSGLASLLGAFDRSDPDNLPDPITPAIIDVQVYYDILLITTVDKIYIGNISDQSYSIIEYNGFITTHYHEGFLYVLYTDNINESHIFKYKDSLTILTDKSLELGNGSLTIDSGFIRIYKDRIELVGVRSDKMLFMAELDTLTKSSDWDGVTVKKADGYLLGGDRDGNRWNMFFEVETIVEGIDTTVISGLSMVLNERVFPPPPAANPECDVPNEAKCFSIDGHTGMMTRVDC